MSNSNVEKLLNDFEEKFEKSKNETVGSMLDSIKKSNELTDCLIELNKATIESLVDDMRNPEITIPVDLKSFILKNAGKLLSDLHVANITGLKSEGSTPQDKKQKLVKPGVNPLLDSEGQEVSKDQIKDAKTLSYELKAHINNTTDLIKKFKTENPTDKS